MPKRKQAKNPFYALLVVVGTLFAVSAAAYGVMAVQAVARTTVAAQTASLHPLLAWLQAHGNAMLLAEVALLGILTFAAIGTDSYWERRGSSDEVGTNPDD